MSEGTTPRAPAAARPAATVLLLRDAPGGMEIFMVVRHREIEFAAGALVFPGGRVEEADAAIAARIPGLPLCDFRVAAIRETFEECGVLIARDGGGRIVPGERLVRIDAEHRAALNAGSRGFAEILAEEALFPDVDGLVHFAHWVTPADLPKRFDTQFFLAEAPADQLAAHDGGESVDSVWIRPADALAEAEAGTRTLLFPTRKNLEKLVPYRTVEEALLAHRRAPVVTVQPRIVEGPDGIRQLQIPIEAGYGGPFFPIGKRAM